MHKKKLAPDVGLNRHTAAAIRKEVLTPPHPPPHIPPPPKSGTQVRGVGSVKIEKSPRRGLLDQVQARTPYIPPFGGHWLRIPQGIVPDV